MLSSPGFIPTLEVADLDVFIDIIKKKGIAFDSEITEGEHVHLVDFYDPNGNRLQAFEFKRKSR